MRLSGFDAGNHPRVNLAFYPANRARCELDALREAKFRFQLVDHRTA
jgi:hypothetical protein